MPTSCSTRPSLVVFADDWGRHPSSSQHLVRRLLDKYDVLWVNSIGTRRLRLDLFTIRRGLEKLRNWNKGVQHTDSRMWVVDLPMLPFGRGAMAQAINRRLVTKKLQRTIANLKLNRPIVLTTLPYMADLIGDVPRQALIYYCTDDYSHWPTADRAAMQQAEQRTLAQADKVLAVSDVLVERFRKHGDCHYFPHGVECRHFAKVASAAISPEIAALPAPRIGFFGLIYEKLNFELLAAVARRFANGRLVLIGPESHCPDWFRQIPNVVFTGPKPYDDLPQWLAGLDVLLMPYVNDEMIRQSNPLKLRECLATGKPTVSIDIPEVRRYQPALRIGGTTDEFVAAVESALDESADLIAAAERMSLVEDDDWDARAAQLDGWLSELLPQTTSAAAY